jgi:hypothetical protein
MKLERWQQLDKLFHAALEREQGERVAFLDHACAGDKSLRKRVEALSRNRSRGAWTCCC